MKVKRVVAGRSDPGREGTVLSVGDAPRTHDFVAVPGMSDTTVWVQKIRHEGLLTPTDISTLVPQSLPPLGGAMFKVVRFPPDSVFENSDFDGEAADAETAAATPGLAECFESGSGGMHQTSTLDYVSVLEGELVLVMGDGSSAHLQRGDVLVLGGGRHRWTNPTQQPGVISVVQIGGPAQVSVPPPN